MGKETCYWDMLDFLFLVYPLNFLGMDFISVLCSAFKCPTTFIIQLNMLLAIVQIVTITMGKLINNIEKLSDVYL